jgi:hypothetical protein
MFIVQPEGKDPRGVVDFRKLNDITVPDRYPAHNPEEIIGLISNAKFLTVFDLTRGYYQIRLSDAAKRYTVASTPFGLYRFNRMPFGLRNASSTFMRLMDRVLAGAESYARSYIDDVVIFSDTFQDHLLHLDDVLMRLRNAGLTVKPSKVQLCNGSVFYLSRAVGSGTVEPMKEKISAIECYPLPSNKTEVRAFLGLTGYYSKFIPMYADIAAPITDLLKGSRCKGGPVKWDQNAIDAFYRLRQSLSSNPVLKAPDYGREFVISCDASAKACGSVLSQFDSDGVEHPIAFASRKLLPREQKYPAIELEMLAVLYSLDKFQPYLFGNRYTVYTDHCPLTYLNSLAKLNNRLARWAACLSQQNVVLKYRRGKLNVCADALSRAPPSPDDESTAPEVTSHPDDETTIPPELSRHHEDAE